MPCSTHTNAEHRRTIGNACGFSTVCWFSHSDAMSAATSRFCGGSMRGFPEGVLSGRLSRVTAYPPSRFSMFTSFQNRFSVASAPGYPCKHRLRRTTTRDTYCSWQLQPALFPAPTHSVLQSVQQLSRVWCGMQYSEEEGVDHEPLAGTCRSQTVEE